MNAKRDRALAVTAITDFMLAGEAFFFAGMLAGRVYGLLSAEGYWAGVLFFLAASALAGGVDHGFLEPYGETALRVFMKRLTWIMIAALTLVAALSMCGRFLSGAIATVVSIAALVQFAVFCGLIFARDDFLVVVLNSAPVMLVLLVLNIAGLGNGSGSWQMIAGLLLSFVASGLQALGVDILHPLDRNGLYHVVLMTAVPFLYLGGLRLL
jgi:hypothetical protein